MTSTKVRRGASMGIAAKEAVVRATAIGVVLALAAGACAGSDGADGSTGAASSTGGETGTTQRPSSPAELTIVAPANGDTVRGTTVDVRIGLENATIVPQTTREISPDEGHLHVTLDGALVSMTDDTEQQLTGLTPGLHRLEVEFVAADHVPFDPRVVVVSAFDVKT